MDNTSSPDGLPWENGVASRKWKYLQNKGYVSDRRTPTNTGLVFYRLGNPSDWGCIDWWGRVIWKEIA